MVVNNMSYCVVAAVVLAAVYDACMMRMDQGQTYLTRNVAAQIDCIDCMTNLPYEDLSRTRRYNVGSLPSVP